MAGGTWGLERHGLSPGRDDPPVVGDLDATAGLPPFACATFWHVLEHLDDPIDVLIRLRASLTPDGLVLAAVPNFGSLQSRILGESWLHLDVPRHLSHFTKTSLIGLFERSGYRVEGVSFGELEYDVIGWSQGLLNRTMGDRNEFFRADTRGGRRRDVGASAEPCAPRWASDFPRWPSPPPGPRAGSASEAPSSWPPDPLPVEGPMMYRGKKIVVVMPAYNAGADARRTYDEIPSRPASTTSSWSTTPAATGPSRSRARLGLPSFVHPENRGYGGNQKTCYREALAARRRHRRHGPPRLPVHAEAASRRWPR